MAKYFGVAGVRKGNVGTEKYYLRNKNSFIQEAKKYIPVNSYWLTKEEFKNYILSLIDKGIPQIYVLQELPEEIHSYALIFVQNQQGTSIYVDKEGIRTLINLQGGGEGADAVDIVNDVPENPKNNTIYFVNNQENNIEKQQLQDTPLECDIYVCDNNVLRKIEVDYTAALDQAKAYTDTKIDALPHLYCHHYFYGGINAGEINFIIYTTQSTKLNLVGLYNFLTNLKCTSAEQYYPVSGNLKDGTVVVGIFASTYGPDTAIVREFSAVYYSGSTVYTQRWNYFAKRHVAYIVQIF